MDIFLNILSVSGIVLLCIIGLALLLAITVLLLKAKAEIGYADKNFFLRLKILCFTFSVFPSAKKSQGASLKKTFGEKPKKKKQGKKSKLFSDYGVFDYIKLIKAVIGEFIKKIYFEKLDVYITVGGDDAAKTALNYGRLNAAVYPIAGFIYDNKRIKELNVSITPDFTAPKSEYNMSAVIYIRVYNAVAAALKLIKYI